MSKMYINWTKGMAPSEIKQALQDGRLRLCSKTALDADQTDILLTTLLRNAPIPNQDGNWVRTLTILAIGSSYTSEPVAQVSIAAGVPGTENIHVYVFTELLCQHCPYLDYCDHASVTSYELRASDLIGFYD